jgi:hypothetical protein
MVTVIQICYTSLLVQDRLRYPFWYFGTDGVTAFDPADTNATGEALSC